MPTSGENANIPSTCTEITTPMIRSSDPPCSMCSGVITITLTIAACAPARPSTAKPSTGRSRTAARARPHDVPVGAVVGISALALATSSGSGRSITPTTTAASTMPIEASANGPVSSGMPSRSAKAPAGPVRLGPATAPIVVAQTTVESDWARRSAAARSVAA
jgi:hypothetical protein